MIYDSIKELIDAIKEEECFKNYHSSLSVFGKPEVKSLMNEIKDLQKDNDQIMSHLQEIRSTLAQIADQGNRHTSKKPKGE